MDIEIRNWDKYNPKRDQKSYSWLRLNNDIATDPDFYDWDAEERFIWIVLLCEASKKNKARIYLNLDWLSGSCKIPMGKVVATIHKLADGVDPKVFIHTNNPERKTTKTQDFRKAAAGDKDEEDSRPEDVVATTAHYTSTTPGTTKHDRALPPVRHLRTNERTDGRDEQTSRTDGRVFNKPAAKTFDPPPDPNLNPEELSILDISRRFSGLRQSLEAELGPERPKLTLAEYEGQRHIPWEGA